MPDSTTEFDGVIAETRTYGDKRAADARAEQKASDDAAFAEASAAWDQTEAELRELVTQLEAELSQHQPPDRPALPLIGMAAPAKLFDQRRREVEATGGRLQAERIFVDNLTPPVERIKAALAAGRHPIVSFKPGRWATLSEASLRTLAGSLAGLGSATVVFNHEPDTQDTPPDIGEGGTAAEFAVMQHKVIDVIKPIAPDLRFAVIMNGWWWTDQARALTDAQIEVWLPRALRERLDVIGADDYSPRGGEPAAVKTRNRVAWAKRVGGVKALGIGETNAFTAKDLVDVFALVLAEPLFRDGRACVWNSAAGQYVPLTETGLVDDFQTILRAWPTD